MAKRLHFIIFIEKGPDAHWRCGNIFLGMDGAIPLNDATALVNLEGVVDCAIVETGCYHVAP
jgi:hypothetical protein